MFSASLTKPVYSLDGGFWLPSLNWIYIQIYVACLQRKSYLNFPVIKHGQIYRNMYFMVIYFKKSESSIFFIKIKFFHISLMLLKC